MPVRTTFEWPDPDDDGEAGRTESFSDSPIVEFTDATGAALNHGESVTESLDSLLVEFTDDDIEFTNFDQDEPT